MEGDVTFGRNLTVRHPHKITIGDNCIIDENCVLDAKGDDIRGKQVEAFILELTEMLPRVYPRYEIILVEDRPQANSESIPNDTLQHVQNLRYFSPTEEFGYGGAIRKAILESRGDFLLTVDPNTKLSLYDLIVINRTQRTSTADFVNGYRVRSTRPHSQVRANPFLHRVATNLFKFRVRDYDSPIKLFKRDLARSMVIEGYERSLVLTEITIKLHVLGARVSECPVAVGKTSVRAIGQKKRSVFKRAHSTWLFLSYLKKRVQSFRAGMIRKL